ncbi:MAG: hypothetical protein Kapaf2KO_00910 [Candidatus Kapaibacteriales bacterium]
MFPSPCRGRARDGAKRSAKLKSSYHIAPNRYKYSKSSNHIAPNDTKPLKSGAADIDEEAWAFYLRETSHYVEAEKEE